MKSVTGYGVVQGGRIVVSHRARFDANVAEVFEEGERVCLTVEKSTRNLRQNALYWVWCTTLAKHYGTSKEYIHSENKRLFNLISDYRADPRTGEMTEVYYPGSTADLSVDAFAEYMNRVQMGWAEQGVNLPDGNDEQC